MGSAWSSAAQRVVVSWFRGDLGGSSEYFVLDRIYLRRRILSGSRQGFCRALANVTGIS